MLSLQILAHINADPAKEFVHIDQIMTKHWAEYGRNYYCRYDYEGVESAKANELMDRLRANFTSLAGQQFGQFTVGVADEFCYLDPIDGSISPNQGIRILFTDGSRVVFRLSGTAGSGATVRMYLEKYEPTSGNYNGKTREALGELVKVSLEEGVIDGAYYSILIVTCVMWSVALDSYNILLSYSIISLEYHITAVLISTLKYIYNS